MDGQEVNSWAELVRSVDHSRKNLPWDPTKTEPVQRASMYEVSLSALNNLTAQ